MAAAKYSLTQAIKLALKKVAGKAIEAEVEEENDRFYYQVKIQNKNKEIFEVLIDMKSGKPVKVEKEDTKESKDDDDDGDDDSDD